MVNCVVQRINSDHSPAVRCWRLRHCLYVKAETQKFHTCWCKDEIHFAGFASESWPGQWETHRSLQSGQRSPHWSIWQANWMKVMTTVKETQTWSVKGHMINRSQCRVNLWELFHIQPHLICLSAIYLTPRLVKVPRCVLAAVVPRWPSVKSDFTVPTCLLAAVVSLSQGISAKK